MCQALVRFTAWRPTPTSRVRAHREGGRSMKRAALLPLGLATMTMAVLSGCLPDDRDRLGHRHGDPGGVLTCTSDLGCPVGSYCDPSIHQCLQSTYCRRDHDCAAGFRCDSWFTCVLGAGGAGGAATGGMGGAATASGGQGGKDSAGTGGSSAGTGGSSASAGRGGGGAVAGRGGSSGSPGTGGATANGGAGGAMVCGGAS